VKITPDLLRAMRNILALTALAACANPNVDTTTKAFSQAKYDADLETCRSANPSAPGEIIGNSVAGIFEGAFEGLIRSGGNILAAPIGAAVGGALGWYKPIKDRDNQLEQCLQSRGYTVNRETKTPGSD
jgi:hypothetical protein